MAENKVKLPQLMTFAEAELEVTTKQCAGQAYSGGKMSQEWSTTPVVVDLAGLEIAAQIPILYNHENEPASRLGVASVTNTGDRLEFAGELYSDREFAKRLIAEGIKYQWQVSIGAEPHEYMYLGEDEARAVNGRDFSGPCLVITKSTLREISLVAVGADRDTHMMIKAALTAGAAGKQAEDNEKEHNMEEIKALEDKVKNLEARLSEVTSRPAPLDAKHDNEPSKAEILKAAFEQSMGVKAADTAAHDKADRMYHGRMGLRQLWTEAAVECGWKGYLSAGTMGEAVSAIKAGFSTVNLPGIVGSVVNRKIREGYDYAEQSWRAIAEIVSTPDFRPIESYTIGVTGDLEEVPMGGTIPHGAVNGEKIENKAKRYGMVVTIDEAEILGDDMDGVKRKAFGLGRKAAVKLNKVLWALFQNDSAFFTAANGNIVTSAGALSVANLGKVVQAFKSLVDAGGDIIGYEPRTLLVPLALEPTALSLFNSTEFRDTTASKSYATANIYRNRYNPVASAYLTNQSDYYLVADPAVAAPIQVAFLEGQEAPVVESSAADFDIFGISYRVKYAFGVAFGDPKSAVKADAE